MGPEINPSSICGQFPTSMPRSFSGGKWALGQITMVQPDGHTQENLTPCAKVTPNGSRPKRKRLRYETQESDLGPGGRAVWLRQDTGRTSRQRKRASQTTSKREHVCAPNTIGKVNGWPSCRRSWQIIDPVRDPGHRTEGTFATPNKETVGMRDEWSRSRAGQRLRLEGFSEEEPEWPASP